MRPAREGADLQPWSKLALVRSGGTYAQGACSAARETDDPDATSCDRIAHQREDEVIA